MADVTRILDQLRQGDHGAAEQLFVLVYDELRKLAARKLAQEKPDQTLDATALVTGRMPGPGCGSKSKKTEKPLVLPRGLDAL